MEKHKVRNKFKQFLGHTNLSTMRYYVNHAESICDEAKSFYAFTIDDGKEQRAKEFLIFGVNSMCGSINNTQSLGF